MVGSDVILNTLLQSSSTLGVYFSQHECNDETFVLLPMLRLVTPKVTLTNHLRGRMMGCMLVCRVVERRKMMYQVHELPTRRQPSRIHNFV